jgi:hypothetical protein
MPSTSGSNDTVVAQFLPATSADLSVEKAKLNDVNNKQYISTRQKKGLYYGEIKISSCFHLPTMRDKHIPV